MRKPASENCGNAGGCMRRGSRLANRSKNGGPLGGLVGQDFARNRLCQVHGRSGDVGQVHMRCISLRMAQWSTAMPTASVPTVSASSH